MVGAGGRGWRVRPIDRRHPRAPVRLAQRVLGERAAGRAGHRHGAAAAGRAGAPAARSVAVQPCAGRGGAGGPEFRADRRPRAGLAVARRAGGGGVDGAVGRSIAAARAQRQPSAVAARTVSQQQLWRGQWRGFPDQFLRLRPAVPVEPVPAAVGRRRCLAVGLAPAAHDGGLYGRQSSGGKYCGPSWHASAHAGWLAGGGRHGACC